MPCPVVAVSSFDMSSGAVSSCGMSSFAVSNCGHSKTRVELYPVETTVYLLLNV